MASYSWTAPDLQQRGPVVTATIAVSAAVEQVLRRAGVPVPPPVPVTALIDTGAAVSAVDRGTAERLGLLPVGEMLLSTPTGPARVPRYLVRIMLTNLVVLETTVVEVQMRDEDNVSVVLGRDVLSTAVFIYVGYTGQCTIAF